MGKIRGIESFGMMASEREMELSDEHSGIIELPSGEVGQSFTDWLAENDPSKVDPVIEIAITPNRAGTRWVCAASPATWRRGGLGTLKPHAPEPVKGSFPCPVKVEIAKDTLDVAPHFRGPPDPGRDERALPRLVAGPAARDRAPGPFRRWSISPISSPTT